MLKSVACQEISSIMSSLRFYISRFLYVGTLLCYLLTPAYGAFPDLGAGARPMGMGGAYIGLANDANAPLWNLAGLTQLTQPELMATFVALYTGLNAQLFNRETDQLGYHFVSYVQLIGPSLGENAAENTALSHSKNVIAVSGLFFDSAFYDEQTYVLSYAKRLTPQISGGIGAKILHLSVASNEYTRAHQVLSNASLSRTSATVDFGLQYALSDQVQLGVVGENLLPADTGILQTEDLPIKWGIGVAHRSGNSLQLLDFVLRERRVNAKRDFNVRLGAEHWLFQRQVGVRMGYNVRSVTLGASYRYGSQTQAQLDYAFIFPIGSIVDTLGSHRVGLSVRF